MSRKEYSYRKMYNALERASSWQAIDLWMPQGVLLSGKWGIDATKLPKWLPKGLRDHIRQVFEDKAEKWDNQNKIIRETLFELENENYVTFTAATQPYVQLSFYHPKA